MTEGEFAGNGAALKKLLASAIPDPEFSADVDRARDSVQAFEARVQQQDAAILSEP